MKYLGYIAAILTLILVLPTVAVGQEIQTQNGAWSSPRRLGTGWWQSMTVDPQGRVHIGWYDVFRIMVTQPGTNQQTPNQADLLRYTSRSLDGEWTISNDVQYTGIGGYTVRNALDVTSDGILHAVFRAHTIHVFSNAYSTIAYEASAWQKPIPINGMGYYMNMIADRNDVLHVAYSGRTQSDLDALASQGGNLERNVCSLCGDVLYLQSRNGGKTWSTARPLISTPNAGSDRIDFFEGSSGRLYITWDEGADWYQGRGEPIDVEMVYSDDGGETWVGPIVFDGGNLANSRPIQIAATELLDGTIMVVWRYDTNEFPTVFYQTSSDRGETWTNPQPVPGFVTRRILDTPLDDYELLVDETGQVHLFAVGYPDTITAGNPSLYHIVYRQGVWLPAQRIFYSPLMWPEWPKAHLGLQNDIHLTWFTRGVDEQIGFTDEQAADPNYLNVYYSHMEGNFPLLPTVEFESTTTPIPSPTPFQILDPTVTPFPTFQVENRSGFVATQDQYATQTLLSSIGATMLFCGLVVLIIRLRRS